MLPRHRRVGGVVVYVGFVLAMGLPPVDPELLSKLEEECAREVKEARKLGHRNVLAVKPSAPAAIHILKKVNGGTEEQPASHRRASDEPRSTTLWGCKPPGMLKKYPNKEKHGPGTADHGTKHKATSTRDRGYNRV